jgi:hypothetical protein
VARFGGPFAFRLTAPNLDRRKSMAECDASHGVRSGRGDAHALQLHAQALDFVDQIQHHGHTLEVGLAIALRPADESHAREFFATEVPC